MAGRRRSVDDIREVLWRLSKGQSDRAIALDLGMGRNTVRSYRTWAEEQKLLDRGRPCCTNTRPTDTSSR